MQANPWDKNDIQTRIRQNLWLLGSMLVLAGAYLGWLAYIGPLTGSNRLDGTLGILLGLFICSHPAANMLDMLMFMSADTREGITTTNAGRFWLFLNLLTVFAAWAVIFGAILRFVDRAS
jgi:hypothetical protein